VEVGRQEDGLNCELKYLSLGRTKEKGLTSTDLFGSFFFPVPRGINSLLDHLQVMAGLGRVMSGG